MVGRLLRTLAFILQHPLNRDRRGAALGRYFSWQIGSRLTGGAVVIPFVEGSKLLATPGMTGVTGVIYCGLSEFDEMGFTLHLLRRGDLVVDVGANVGVYTILSAAVGASVVSFEPIRSAAERLRQNVRLNGFDDQVDLQCLALGSERGRIHMTTALDTVNRVVESSSGIADVAEVSFDTLDRVLGSRDVTLLKIDVEGWEAEVLRGAESLLKHGRVQCLIIETNGNARRYGMDDTDLDSMLRPMGYRPFSYDPSTRQLVSPKRSRSNTIYILDKNWVLMRLANPPARHLPFGKVL